MLYYVKKMDVCSGIVSAAIVRASSEEEALKKLHLTPADLQELNEPYERESYPRFSAFAEKIDFRDNVYYL